MVAVSVIMTAFNAGQFLAEAVSSVLKQDFFDWELILVDNSSTDGSLERLNVLDSRIQLIRLPQNIGRTRAICLAVSRAKGEFCAVLDADDIAMNDRLQFQVNYLRRNPEVVLLGSHVVELLDTGREIERNSPSGLISHDQLAERNVFVHSSVMFRREVYVSIGGYDERFRYAQDYDLFQRFAMVGECHILNIPLTKLRIHSNSETRKSSSQHIRIADELALSELAPKRLNLSSRGLQLNKRRQALCTLERAWHEFRRAKFFLALWLFRDVIRRDPEMSWIFYLVRGRPIPFN
jgi:glycosyltransferase involved in cell wall biosynthesis